MKKHLITTLIASSLILLSGCSANSIDVSNKDYIDYESYYLTSLDEFYKLEDNSYFVYLYSDVCSHCDDIKKEIFTYLENMTLSSFSKSKLYIYNMHSIKTNEGMINRNQFKQIEDSEGKTQEQLINEMVINKPTSLKETYFFGTPSLYLIENNSFSNLKIGTREVVSSLNNELINYDDIIISLSMIVGLTLISTLFLRLAVKLNNKYN